MEGRINEWKAIQCVILIGIYMKSRQFIQIGIVELVFDARENLRCKEQVVKTRVVG